MPTGDAVRSKKTAWTFASAALRVAVLGLGVGLGELAAPTTLSNCEDELQLSSLIFPELEWFPTFGRCIFCVSLGRTSYES